MKLCTFTYFTTQQLFGFLPMSSLLSTVKTRKEVIFSNLQLNGLLWSKSFKRILPRAVLSTPFACLVIQNVRQGVSFKVMKEMTSMRRGFGSFEILSCVDISF